MELLNINFAILLVKVVICVLPGVIGISALVLSEEAKRELRSKFCQSLFGVNNAIPYKKFARTLVILSVLMILFSLVVSWFLLLAPMFK